MRSPDDATATTRSNGLALLLVALVVLVGLAVGRGHPLQNLNEGVYARIAQEMLERRDFIVPTLDGVPYLEKPPLLYWVTAASFAAFGSNEAAARVGPLVGELIALGGALWFARRHLAPTADRYALAISALRRSSSCSRTR